MSTAPGNHQPQTIATSTIHQQDCMLPKRFVDPPAVTPRAAAWIYAMLERCDKTLAALGIRCYAEGGTLLGLARDGGIIRHDDDGDLQIHPEDTELFIAAIPELERLLCIEWARNQLGVDMRLRRSSFGCKLILYSPPHPEDQWEVLFNTLSQPAEWAPGFAVIDFFLMDVHHLPLPPGQAPPTATPSTTTTTLTPVCRYADPIIQQMVVDRGNGGDILLARLGSLPEYQFGPIKLRAPEDLRGATIDQFGPHCFHKAQTKAGSTHLHHSSLAIDHDHDLYVQLSSTSSVDALLL